MLDQSLQPQQARAAMLGQRLEQQGQRERRHGAVALQHEGLDAVGVLRASERIARRWIGQRGEAGRDVGAGEQRGGHDVAGRLQHARHD